MFVPKRAFIDEEALDYPHGRKILRRLKQQGETDITVMPSGGRVTSIPGSTPGDAYRQGKMSLVVRVLGRMDFPTCRPSADYALPITTGCPGSCEYCYLITQFGRKPYLTVYANVDEILDRAAQYAAQSSQNITTFEGAASSDPVPTERYSGALESAIEHFSDRSDSRFRFVTKFDDIEPLLSLQHSRHTLFRFSINTEKVCRDFERGTPAVKHRLKAAARVSDADYPLGFVIAPVLLTSSWRRDYRALLESVVETVGDTPVSFEIISHRFTDAALRKIRQIFPDSDLPLQKSRRMRRTGRYGHGKYVYPPERLADVRSFFEQSVGDLFSGASVDYVV